MVTAQHGWMAAAMALACVGMMTARGQENVPLPTADEVKQQADAGNYRDALKGLSRIVALKGPAAAAYDRQAMLLLKAECHLQLRDSKNALDALAEAYKEAVKGQKDASESLALAALIQNSPRFEYVPKAKSGAAGRGMGTGAATTGKPINILDKTSRKEAYKALFEDQLAATRAKVAAADSARTIAPIMEAAKMAGALQAIEKAGTGDVAQSKAVTEEVSTHALLLLTGAFNDASLKSQGISFQANQVVNVPIPRIDAQGQQYTDTISQRRGLTGDDAQILKGVEQTCTQIISAAQELATALATDVDKFKDLARSANTVGRMAEGLIKEQ